MGAESRLHEVSERTRLCRNTKNCDGDHEKEVRHPWGGHIGEEKRTCLIVLLVKKRTGGGSALRVKERGIYIIGGQKTERKARKKRTKNKGIHHKNLFLGVEP